MIRIDSALDATRLLTAASSPVSAQRGSPLPRKGSVEPEETKPLRTSGLQSARVELRPVTELRLADEVLGFAGIDAPDVLPQMQRLVDHGGGFGRIEAIAPTADGLLRLIIGGVPRLMPVGLQAFVVVRTAPADPAETRLELDPDAEPPVPDDAGGYCAEPECTAPAMDGDLCGFHAQAARDAEGGAS